MEKTNSEKPRFPFKGIYFKPQMELKYLGIVLDNIRNFGKDTEMEVSKAKA